MRSWSPRACREPSASPRPPCGTTRSWAAAFVSPATCATTLPVALVRTGNCLAAPATPPAGVSGRHAHRARPAGAGFPQRLRADRQGGCGAGADGADRDRQPLSCARAGRCSGCRRCRSSIPCGWGSASWSKATCGASWLASSSISAPSWTPSATLSATLRCDSGHDREAGLQPRDLREAARRAGRVHEPA